MGRETEMSLLKITLENCLDNYGRDMSASVLADWVEYCALCGDSLPWQNTKEEMREGGIPSELIDSDYYAEDSFDEMLSGQIDQMLSLQGDVYEDGNLGPDEESAEDNARELLETRSAYLGDLYPFERNNDNSLVIRQGFSLRNNPYLIMLVISLLKGWIYPKETGIITKLGNAFEVVTGASICSAGLGLSIIGTSNTRLPGVFTDRLSICAREMGLLCDTRTIAPSKNSKDENVDIISGVLMQDYRLGEPAWLIQATCAKNGETWSSKLRDINTANWKSYLRLGIPPFCFLAVPYHMTNQSIKDLLRDDEHKSFLDRLRLAKLANAKSIKINDDHIGAIMELVDLALQYGIPAEYPP